jgi:hypothetical protein
VVATGARSPASRLLPSLVLLVLLQPDSAWLACWHRSTCSVSWRPLMMEGVVLTTLERAAGAVVAVPPTPVAQQRCLPVLELMRPLCSQHL